MMDDCVLDDVPFGYCMVDVGSSRPQGWSEPLEYGCLARVEDVREEGSNLLLPQMVTVVLKSRKLYLRHWITKILG